jgi:hypothetical protein
MCLYQVIISWDILLSLTSLFLSVLAEPTPTSITTTEQMCYEKDEENEQLCTDNKKHFMNNNMINNQDKSKEKYFFRVECNWTVLQMLIFFFFSYSFIIYSLPTLDPAPNSTELNSTQIIEIDLI